MSLINEIPWEVQTVTMIDASRVIRNPTITIEPNVIYSFNPVKCVISVAGSCTTLGASGVEIPFSGSKVTEDGDELSIMRSWNRECLRNLKKKRTFSQTLFIDVKAR
jgi:hypothetical protein